MKKLLTYPQLSVKIFLYQIKGGFTMNAQQIKPKLIQIKNSKNLETHALYLPDSLSFTFQSNTNIILLNNSFVLGNRFTFSYKEVLYII